MLSLVRAYDWGSTPLGPMERWSQSLKAAVSLMLECRLPMYIAWGPQFTQLYNDAYRPILGNKHPAALGASAPDTWTEIWSTIGPMWQEVLQGKPVGFDGFKLTIERFGYPEDVYFNFSYSAVRDDGGSAAGVLVAFAETTEQVLNERRLRFLLELDDATRVLEDSGEITLAAARLLGQFLSVNRCAYADVEDDEDTFNLSGDYNDGVPSIVGRYRFAQFGQECLRLMRENKPYIVVDSETDPRTVDVRESYRATKIRSVICVPLHKSGRFVAAMAVHKTEPREWRPDEVELLLTVASRCWESIERTRVTRELKEMDRRKDEFLAMLAHELRNPLTPILNAAQILKIKLPNDPDLRMPTDMIARQVAHMTALVDDLLDVSRVTRGIVALDMQEVDMRDVVTNAVEQCRSLVDIRRHSLAIETGSEPHRVYGDRHRLVQIVTNLLNNAAKFTANGGSLLVSLKQTPTTIEVAVRDNGIGIRQEMIPRVFDLFIQGERSADRSQGGLGVGLALVKRLVELHGGEVRAESPGSGEGSTFSVWLPKFAGSHAASTITPAGRDDGRCTPLRLMIVDDNVDAALSMAQLLSGEGHAVTVEHDPRTALRHVGGDAAFDAMLLDIGLPGMDGYELARRLRAAPKTANVLLIALTGYGQADDRKRSKDAGFDYHMVKPADIRELNALLASRARLWSASGRA